MKLPKKRYDYTKITNDKTIPPGGKWKVKIEDMVKADELIEDVHTFRGWVLHLAVNVENWIELIIAKVYDIGASSEFIDIVLKKTGFRQKVKMLKALAKKRSEIPDSNAWKEFTKKLDRIVDIRNMFAHDEAYVRGTETIIENEIINMDFFNEVNNLFNEVISQLRTMFGAIKKKPNPDTK